MEKLTHNQSGTGVALSVALLHGEMQVVSQCKKEGTLNLLTQSDACAERPVRYIFPAKITFDKSKTIIRLSLVTRTINKIRFRQ